MDDLPAYGKGSGPYVARRAAGKIQSMYTPERLAQVTRGQEREDFMAQSANDAREAAAIRVRGRRAIPDASEGEEQ
jgi:hypothetical protein